MVARCRIKAGYWPDVRIFRNNVGVLTDVYGNHVRFGLCPGSSDLIGWRTITITPDMVGKPIAQFMALEGKRHGGKPSEIQENFIAAVIKAGGHAGVFSSEQEFTTIVTEGMYGNRTR